MKYASSLILKFSIILPWEQTWIEFAAQFIIPLMQARTCNLKRLADTFKARLNRSLVTPQIKRFFKDFQLNFKEIASAMLQWLDQDQFLLTVERTNWQFGKSHANYLVISIVYQGVAIQQVRKCLDKKGGNSNSSERIELAEQVLELIPAQPSPTLPYTS